jgi:hypothetical protein
MRFFSTGEVARLLQVPKYKVEYQRACGRLPDPVRVGSMHVYTAFDVVKIAEVLGVDLPVFKEEE